MLKTKVVKAVNLSPLLHLDLHRELNDAAAVVKTDIQQRYEKDINIDGSKTRALAASTIIQKRNAVRRANDTVQSLKDTGRKDLVRKGKRIGLEAATISKNAEKPLVATESLWRNQKIDKATAKNQKVIISIGQSSKFGEKNDDKIYSYHHEGGGRLPARPKFGIGNGVDAKIDELIIRKIDSIINGLGK